MKPQIWAQSQEEKKSTEILESVKDKFYRARSGAVTYLICKETKKKVVTAFNEEEFTKQVISFFR